LVQSNLDLEKIFLQFHIDAIDRQIDQLVQELYRLIARCSPWCSRKHLPAWSGIRRYYRTGLVSGYFRLIGFEGKKPEPEVHGDAPGSGMDHQMLY